MIEARAPGEAEVKKAKKGNEMVCAAGNDLGEASEYPGQCLWVFLELVTYQNTQSL